MDYLDKNQEYWNGRYNAPNVESFIFRFYGRILKHDYGIDGSNHETIFDFGCGQGGNLLFFHKLGFRVYGADIAQQDLEAAKNIIPNNNNHFILVDKQPNENLEFFSEIMDEGGFDIAISIQTLDFLSNSDFAKALNSIYRNMKPGAKIFASMNTWDMYYRQNATYVDDGIWHVKFDNGRVKYDLGLNFVKDKDEMRSRFDLFKCIYIDHYSHSFREEGNEERFTFFGVKD